MKAPGTGGTSTKAPSRCIWSPGVLSVLRSVSMPAHRRQRYDMQDDVLGFQITAAGEMNLLRADRLIMGIHHSQSAPQRQRCPALQAIHDAK